MHKNSVLPFILLLITLMSLPLCIHQRDSQGYDGPSLFEGMYRGQEGRFIASIPPAQVTVSNEISEVQDILGKSQLRDYRQGLEGPSWDNVLIYAEDDHAVTRSVAKALAELLTGMLDEDPYGMAMPFYLVHVQPHDKHVRPWGVSRIIRVRTIKADQHPASISDTFNAEVSICLQDPRLPAAVRPLMPLAAGGVQEQGLRVRHRIHSDSQDVSAFNWANWHATIGRSIAGVAMRHCWSAESEELDWQQLDYDQTVGAWRTGDPKDVNEDGLPKKTLLPVQPGHKVVTWLAGFQEPLARGWCGAIIGTERQSRMGSVTQTFTKWQEHLDGSGSWQQDQLPDDRVWLWRHLNKQMSHMHAVLTRQYDFGAEILAWQVMPGMNQQYQSWLQAAQSGDDAGRVMIRRYLLATQIDADLRQQALQVLRQDPSAAETALIGLHPEATPEEQHAAAAIAFVRGISNEQPSAQALQAVSPAQVKWWDRRPLLLRFKNTLLIVLYQQHGRNKQAARGQIWWRHLSNDSQPQRSDFIDLHAQCGEVAVSLEPADKQRFDITIK